MILLRNNSVKGCLISFSISKEYSYKMDNPTLKLTEVGYKLMNENLITRTIFYIIIINI